MAGDGHPRRLRALLNAGGGTVARLGREAVRERLEAAFRRHGAEVEIAFLEGGALGGELARALADARAGRLDGVVVGGGDGTVGTAAGVLAGTGVPLGVLPLGTLNHFAKDLGMPLGLEEAAGVLATARARPVDVGECNGRVFVNNSLLGAYPYLAADRERRRRLHGLGKRAATFLALLRVLWRFPRRRLSVITEGSAKAYRTPALYVGVNRYTIGNLTWRRQGGLDDGELWLLVARHRHWAGFARFAFRTAVLGLDPRERDFETLATRAGVEIGTKASRVPVSFDGELERMRGPLRYRVRPGALLVLAPPSGQRDEAAA